jgi:hypothetical protein
MVGGKPNLRSAMAARSWQSIGLLRLGAALHAILGSMAAHNIPKNMLRLELKKNDNRSNGNLRQLINLRESDAIPANIYKSYDLFSNDKTHTFSRLWRRVVCLRVFGGVFASYL